MAKLDIHQHVTDTIIEQIEAGTPPWRRPWTGGSGGAAFPLRHNSEAYRGINVLMLWAVAQKQGYSSPYWMTFKQARDLGGMVRKGEKCARSVFYGTFERDDENGAVEEQSEGHGKTRIPYAKTNNVFNAAQIEGLPDEFYIQPDPPRDLGTETIPEVEAFFARTGARIITHDEPSAYYQPSTDTIHMPPVATFYDANGYFGTVAHETIHWTGLGMRLDRFRKFGTRQDTAFEEMVAEIGSCMLCLHLGVTPQFDQSAAYVEGWLKALRNEKGLIFKASSEAQKAVDYVLSAAEANQQGEAA